MKCIDENGNIEQNEWLKNKVLEIYGLAKFDIPTRERRPLTITESGFLVPECMGKTIFRRLDEMNYRYRALADRCMCAAMRTEGVMKQTWEKHEKALRNKYKE